MTVLTVYIKVSWLRGLVIQLLEDGRIYSIHHCKVDLILKITISGFGPLKLRSTEHFCHRNMTCVAVWSTNWPIRRNILANAVRLCDEINKNSTSC